MEDTLNVGRIAVYNIYYHFLSFIFLGACLRLCARAKPLTPAFMTRLMTGVDIWVHKSFLTQPGKEPAVHSSA